MTDTTREDYDDTEELVRYVLKYYPGFKTHLESQIVKAIWVRAQEANDPDFAAKFRKRFGLEDDARVAEALEAGPETCRRVIAHRILCDHADEIDVNRCPRCRRIARTPKARQCFRCGHDWHESTH